MRVSASAIVGLSCFLAGLLGLAAILTLRLTHQFGYSQVAAISAVGFVAFATPAVLVLAWSQHRTLKSVEEFSSQNSPIQFALEFAGKHPIACLAIAGTGGFFAARHPRMIAIFAQRMMLNFL